MADKIAVIGLGQFGYAVARRLASKGAEVLAIDMDEDRVELIKDDVAYAVTLDSTDIKALQSQNITEMDAVMLAIGENIEGLLLTTVQLLEMNVKRIIARAMSDQQRRILEKLGVKEIISPEDEAANTVAELLMNPNILSYLNLPDHYQIVEIKVPKRLSGKTLGELDIKENYGLSILTMTRYYEEFFDGRKSFTEHMVSAITDDTVLEASDSLYLLGKAELLQKFLEINA